MADGPTLRPESRGLCWLPCPFWNLEPSWPRYNLFRLLCPLSQTRTIFTYHQLHFILSRFTKLSVHHTAMALLCWCFVKKLRTHSLTQCIACSNISSFPSSTLLTHYHPISISNPQKCLGFLLTDYSTTLSCLPDKHVPLRGVYPYLPMATNAPWSVFFLGGGNQLNV